MAILRSIENDPSKVPVTEERRTRRFQGFSEIGQVPSIECFRHTVQKNAEGEIITDDNAMDKFSMSYDKLTPEFLDEHPEFQEFVQLPQMLARLFDAIEVLKGGTPGAV